MERYDCIIIVVATFTLACLCVCVYNVWQCVDIKYNMYYVRGNDRRRRRRQCDKRKYDKIAVVTVFHTLNISMLYREKNNLSGANVF